MKVAFTSSDGETIDRHFGQVERFHVWDVQPDRAEPAGTVSAVVTSGDEEDRTTARASAVAGCALVYTLQIGGPAAAKLVARRVHPLKTNEPLPIAAALERLQEVMRRAPPPWLRKAMERADRILFAE
jgi:nitrogen fixation protein NifX